MNTRKTILHQVCAALPLARTPAMSQVNGLVAVPRQPSRSRLALASALGLGMCGLFLLPGCQVVSVHEQDADGIHCPKSVPGIPYVTKKVVRKQETVWQQNGIRVSLTLKLDPPKKKDAPPDNTPETIDLGFLVVGPDDVPLLISLFAKFTNPLTIVQIHNALTEYLTSPDARGLSLVSNREIRQTVFDDKRYYITVYKPLIGTATFAPKFNTDAMLTEFTATVEDKTIPTLLEPFKDALSTLANTVAKDAALRMLETGTEPTVKPTEPTYRVIITKPEKTITRVITVTKELHGKHKIGEPIPPPQAGEKVSCPCSPSQAGEKVSCPCSPPKDGDKVSDTEGVEVVISIPKPDDKKAEDDKGAFKFSGSVLPPMTDK